MAILKAKKHIINSKGEHQLLNIYTTRLEANHLGEPCKVVRLNIDGDTITGYIGLTKDLNTDKASSKMIEINGEVYAERKYMGVKDHNNYMKRTYPTIYNITQEITDDMVPIDTSDSENTSYFFSDCENTTVVPFVDTINSRNLSYMYNNCRNVLRFPIVNFDKATNIDYIYFNCENAEEFENLDNIDITKFNSIAGFFGGQNRRNSWPIELLKKENKINIFTSVFENYNGHLELPYIYTNKGILFNKYFKNCINTKVFPYVNTEKATDISEMFYNSNAITLPPISSNNVKKIDGIMYNNSKLKIFPNIDTSKVVDFSNLATNCSFDNDIEIDLSMSNNNEISNITTENSFLNTTSNSFVVKNSFNLTPVNTIKNKFNMNNIIIKNYGVQYMFKNNEGTEFEEIDTSECSNFTEMYYGCLNAIKVSTIDFSKAIDKELNSIKTTNMFKGCDKLTHVKFVNVPYGVTEETIRRKTSLNEDCVIEIEYGGQYLFFNNSDVNIDEVKFEKSNNLEKSFYMYNGEYTGDIDTSKAKNLREMFSKSKFETFNITSTKNSSNFVLMFNECENAISFPTLDIEKTLSLCGLYKDCINALNFPKLKTAHIKDMSYMYYNCRSNIEFPEIDTSSCINFYNMYKNCSKAIKVTTINLGMCNSKDFDDIVIDNMFEGCENLLNLKIINFPFGARIDDFIEKTKLNKNCNVIWEYNFEKMFSHRSDYFFSSIDTSKGTNFNETYNMCATSAVFPFIDTSNGIFFNKTYYGCNSTSKFPMINTSKGKEFAETFSECYIRNAEIPPIDTSNGVVFDGMFKNSRCIIPNLDTSKGKSFKNMFNGYLNEEFPTLDLSSVETLDEENNVFENMFHGVITENCLLRIKQLSNLIDVEKLKEYMRFNGNLYIESRSVAFKYKNSQEEIFDEIDTSECINFKEMYYGCSNAIKVSTIDFSRARNKELSNLILDNMLSDCFSLESVVFRNVPIGTEIKTIKEKCGINNPNTKIIIESFGMQHLNYWNIDTVEAYEVDTSKITVFDNMYSYNLNITLAPTIDLLSATDNKLSNISMNNMFTGCSELRSVKFVNVPLGVTERMLRDKASIPNTCVNVVIENVVHSLEVDRDENVKESTLNFNIRSISYGARELFKNKRDEIFHYVDTSKYVDFTSMFEGCINAKKIPVIDLSASIDNKLSNLIMDNMFTGCDSLENITFINVPLGVAEDFLREKAYIPNHCNVKINYGPIRMFKDSDITISEEIDTRYSSNFTSMYENCENLIKATVIDLSQVNDYEWLTDIRGFNAFKNCNNLREVVFTNVPYLTTKNQLKKRFSIPESCDVVIKDYGMQFRYKNTDIGYYEKIDTSNSINFTSMYEGCTYARVVADLDFINAVDNRLSNIKYKNVFKGCKILPRIVLKNLPIGINKMDFLITMKVPDVTMVEYSYYCKNAYKDSLNEEFEDIETKYSTDFTSMYENCENAIKVSTIDFYSSSEKDLSDIKTSNMFSGCNNLKFIEFVNVPNGATEAIIREKTNIPDTCTNVVVKYGNQSKFRDMLDIEFEELDTSTTTNFNYMFSGCSNAILVPIIDFSMAIDEELSNLDLNNMFKGCNALRKVKFVNVPLKTKKETIRNKTNLHFLCEIEIEYAEYAITVSRNENNFSSLLEYSEKIFAYGLKNKFKNSKDTLFKEIDTSTIVNFESMYENCENAIKVSTINLNSAKDNTLNNIYLHNAFKNCNNLENIRFINVPYGVTEELLRTKAVIPDNVKLNIEYGLQNRFKNHTGNEVEYIDTCYSSNFTSAFENAINLSEVFPIDLSQNNDYEYLTDIRGMNAFKNCNISKVKFINAPIGIYENDLRNKFSINKNTKIEIEYGAQFRYRGSLRDEFESLDTSNMINFTSMFEGCKNVKSLPVISFKKAFDETLYNLKLNNIFKDCESIRSITISDIPLKLTEKDIRTLLKINDSCEYINTSINCKKLYLNSNEVNFENIKTYLCRDFESMYENCSNANSVSVIDFSMAINNNLDGINTRNMFLNSNNIINVEFKNVPYGTSEETIRSKTSLNENTIVNIKYGCQYRYENTNETTIICDDTSLSTNFEGMFKNAINLTSVKNISLLATNDQYLGDMNFKDIFYNCRNLIRLEFVDCPHGLTKEYLAKLIGVDEIMCKIDISYRTLALTVSRDENNVSSLLEFTKEVIK